jgi:hypothetical protein
MQSSKNIKCSKTHAVLKIQQKNAVQNAADKRQRVFAQPLARNLKKSFSAPTRASPKMQQ